MILHSTVLLLSLALWFQAAAAPPKAATADCLTAVEKDRLSKENNINSRIKIYRQISERFHKGLLSASARPDTGSVPSLLGCWKEQLTAASKDIDANINRKKKSGALIDFEIQLRKSIGDVNDARLKAPVEQNSRYQDWLDEASRIHEQFVSLIFQR
jgi:hypothetical protein